MGGYGALLDDKYPLVCGGYVRNKGSTSQCAILGGEQELSSIEERESPSSILIDSSTLWVTGGLHYEDGNPMGVKSATSEYISLNEDISGPGPDLPIHVWSHCLVRTEAGALLTGGISNEILTSSQATFWFDNASAEWRKVY